MRLNLTVFPGRRAAARPEPMNTAFTQKCSPSTPHLAAAVFMGSGLSAYALPRNDGEASEAMS